MHVAPAQSWHGLCNRFSRLRESGAEPRNRYRLCGLGGMTKLIFDVTNPKKVGGSTEGHATQQPLRWKPGGSVQATQAEMRHQPRER